jgi:hypothetical protein
MFVEECGLLGSSLCTIPYIHDILWVVQIVELLVMYYSPASWCLMKSTDYGVCCCTCILFFSFVIRGAVSTSFYEIWGSHSGVGEDLDFLVDGSFSLTFKFRLLPIWELLLRACLLTPWSRAFLEKLTDLQLVKKCPAFSGTRRFITVFTGARHLSLS